MKHHPSNNGGCVSTKWKQLCERIELWYKVHSGFASEGAAGMLVCYHYDKKCDTLSLIYQINISYDKLSAREYHKNEFPYYNKVKLWKKHTIL